MRMPHGEKRGLAPSKIGGPAAAASKLNLERGCILWVTAQLSGKANGYLLNGMLCAMHGEAEPTRMVQTPDVWLDMQKD